MKFCLEDGSSLIEQLAPTRLGSATEATLHMPGPAEGAAQGHSTAQPSTITSIGFQPAVGTAAQFPVEPNRRGSRALSWIVVALIIGGSGIAIAIIVTRGRSLQTAAMPSMPTPVPAATQATGASESTSPQTTKPATADRLAEANPQTEKPTPPPKTTPANKSPPVENSSVSSETPTRPQTISGGVLNGKATYLAKPTYPPIARSSNASGTVTVQVLVDENGNVISAHALSGHPLLQASAVAAARASKFTPTKLSGQPVKVSGVIIYNFQMQ